MVLKTDGNEFQASGRKAGQGSDGKDKDKRSNLTDNLKKNTS